MSGADVFDADTRDLAVRRPAVRLGGRVYRGRVLSALEWEPHRQKLQTVLSAIGDVKDEDDALRVNAELRIVFRDYCLEVFRSRWNRRRAARVVRRILALPETVQSELLVDFFACQGQALGTRSPPVTVLSTSAPAPGASGKPVSRPHAASSSA